MHGEGQVGLRLGGQHAGRRKPRIVDERRIVVSGPVDRIGRIRHDRLERLLVPVLRLGERVTQGDVEVGVVDAVQEHVNAAQVVGGQVDLLPEVALAHTTLAKHLPELQQQRARTARRVVHLVHVCLADHRDAGEQLGHLLGCVELPARLAGAGGIHRHEVFVGVAEQVNRVLAEVAQG